MYLPELHHSLEKWQFFLIILTFLTRSLFLNMNGIWNSSNHVTWYWLLESPLAGRALTFLEGHYGAQGLPGLGYGGQRTLRGQPFKNTNSTFGILTLSAKEQVYVFCFFGGWEG